MPTPHFKKCGEPLPGEEIGGRMAWHLGQPPKEVELRLFRFARGNGHEDTGAADSCSFERPQAGDSRSFRMRLPEAPYSFSGKLFSIVWALELVPKPGKDAARVEITMGPGSGFVRLL